MSIRKTIMYILSVILLSNVSITYASSLNDLKNKQKEVQEERHKTEELFESAKNVSDSLLDEIEVLDAQIAAVETEIDHADAQLLETSIQLSISERELVEAEKKSAEQYETMGKRIRFMYENGNIGYLEVILKASSFSDFLNRVEFINIIMEHDRNLLSSYQATRDKLAEKKVSIEAHKIEIQSLQASLNTKKMSLLEIQNQKSATLANIEADKSMYMQQIAELENSSNQIQELIREAERKEAERKEAERREAERKEAERREAEERRIAAEKRTAEEQKIAAEKSKSNPSATGNGTTNAPSGQLQWPVPGYYPTSSSYGRRVSPITGVEEFHTGLDIPAPKGTNVLVAESGVVISSGVIRGYGNAVIVDHGNGLTTLYAHNSSLVVSEGDTVKRGQIIAKVGSTGYSTGNHSHVEVRINGSPTDPSKYFAR